MKKYYAPTEAVCENAYDLQNCVTADIEVVYTAREVDASLAAKDREIAELRADAERWRALRNCARITAMGSAGCQPDGRDFETTYAHVTLNFWTHSSTRESEPWHREWLDVFVTKAVAAMKERA